MSEWKILKIGDICDVIAGQSPKGEFYNSEGLGLPFYQGKKEFGKKFISSPQTWTTSVTKVAIAGDILMSIRAPVGPVNFATQKICIGRGLAAIRARESIDKNFLFYYLFSNQDNIKGNEGAVFASINKSQIQNISLPVPPIEEQKRIVEILDKAFEGIAQAEANTRRNLINARELFDSYLNQVFTKHDQNWTQEPLGKVCTLQRGYDLPQRLRVEGKFPLVSSSGIIDSHQEAKVKAPGVVTGRSGSIGSLFYVKENFWPLNTVLYVKDFHENDPEFIFYLLKHFNLGKYASGTGVPTLNRNHVHSVLVKKPIFIEEQKNLVKSLNKLQEYQKRLETIYQRKLEAIAELKQSILEKAFTGQLSQ